MKRAWVLLLVGAAAILSGCIALPCRTLTGCPTPSPAFRQVEGLSSSGQTDVMKRIPLEERLDIYHDVYIRSGHPRTMLTRGFEGSGEAGFDAALGRMVDRSSFNEYFWIIHSLSLDGEVDVCDPRRLGALSEKAVRFKVGDPRHPVPINFGVCALIL
ncbi:MAG: hypothetical protein Q7U72_10435 [Brevundimonas sp.]|jgi:hypothetical protein|uniref:hypothetical protein n=1 Tax=Brevundimonas sp. TaxID=1871086 RepID=UPI00271CD5A6|nr:hypothetical protein [Brevundimonas sp.]MDO9077852.1 hypothetical protein [Brevundimonas sp.]MDZ4062904.1 hypothetical protein [Brevundimonas sp.]